MGRDQPQVPISVIVFSGAHQKVVHGCMGLHELPGSFYVDGILGIFADVLEGGTSQSIKAHSCKPFLNNLVRSKNLGVGFLNQHDPKLVFVVP